MITWFSKELEDVIIAHADELDNVALHYPTVEEVFTVASVDNSMYIVMAPTDGETEDAAILTNDLTKSIIADVSKLLDTYNSVIFSNRIGHCKEVMDVLLRVVSQNTNAWERLRDTV